MSQEQLNAVKEQLLSEENEALRQSIFSAYLEEPERGAKMIIAFATDKGLTLNVAPSEIIDYIDNLDDDIDIEMTPEMLASVAGGWYGTKYYSKANMIAGLGPQNKGPKNPYDT